MQKNSPVAVKDGKYSIWWDEIRGSVAVELAGLWSASDMQEFVASLGVEIDKSRARHGNALILFDATTNQIMPSPLSGQVTADSKKLSHANDRVAIVVGSSLLKLQIKRVSSANSNTEFFLSRNAADTWLHAHIAPSGGRTPAGNDAVAPAIRQVG